MAWLKKIYKRVGLRGISSVFAVLLALPLGWQGMTGIYSWLSPFVMLNSLIALKSVVLLNSLGLVVLTIVIIRKRWFCRKLCPFGFVCDVVSGCSPKKETVVKKIPSIGKWIAIISLTGAIVGFPVFIILDPMSIFNGFFGAFTKSVSPIVIISLAGFPVLVLIHLILPGIWCSKLCPLGGLQDFINQIKTAILSFKKKESKAETNSYGGRRLFLFSTAGLLSGLFMPRLLKGEETSAIRPPGSVNNSLFNILCTRCGNCVKACPSSIIVHRKDAEDAISWMTPEIQFTDGYCLEDCNECGEVCPSGAISIFDVNAKNILKIASAKVILEGCLLIQNKECDRCKAVCRYDAITIKSSGDFDAVPVIDQSKCVGCGACLIICPTETISVK